MQTNDTKDDEGQQEVEREDPVQGLIVDRETAPQPGHDGIADDRYCREQVRDDGRASKAHLTSWQYIAYKRSGHGQYQYQGAR